MSRTDLLGTGIRVVAIWLFLNTLQNVTGIVWLFSQAGASQSSAKASNVVLGLGLPLLASALLWLGAHRAALLLLPPPPAVEAGTTPTRRDLELVVLLGIGVYLLASRVASLTYWFIFLDRSRAREADLFRLEPSHLASIARTTVELLFAVWLIRGAPGLGRLRGRALVDEATGDATD